MNDTPDTNGTTETETNGKHEGIFGRHQKASVLRIQRNCATFRKRWAHVEATVGLLGDVQAMEAIANRLAAALASVPDDQSFLVPRKPQAAPALRFESGAAVRLVPEKQTRYTDRYNTLNVSDKLFVERYVGEKLQMEVVCRAANGQTVVVKPSHIVAA